MAKLDEKGRCCGRKPLLYKLPLGECMAPFRFCPRCDRAFDVEGEQIPNWAYRRDKSGAFLSKKSGSVTIA
jgi:hypothetical protein